jgi:hypothetical protein
VSDDVVRKLKIDGFRIGIDIILKRPGHLYMNAMSFNKYMPTVLLPHIARV